MQRIHTEYNGFLFTSNKELMNVNAVHKWLSEISYWKKNIPFTTVETALENSFCVSVLKDQKQIGFSRLITDYTTFAYFADVYILEEYRNNGFSKKMIELVLTLDWVQNLQRIMLGTLDAHDLYKKYGFSEMKFPERFMEISRPSIYNDPNNPFI